MDTKSRPQRTQARTPAQALPESLEKPPISSADLAGAEEKGDRRRRRQKNPDWYTTEREDPTTLQGATVDMESVLAQYNAYLESKKKRGSESLRTSEVLVSLPQRELDTPEFSINPNMMRQQERFKASLLSTFFRFVAWILGIFRYQSGVLWDKLRGKDTEQNRAARLLSTIEKIGGTLIKFGQQLAMRVDLLPYAYCVELSKLFDNMPSFPIEEAIRTIERSTGRKLTEIFARFDPHPIGSASVSCVYKAVLRTGECVAVKVRRPGIGQRFAADLRALRWIIGLVEWLTIIRPGSLRNFAEDLEISFMEELDFRTEAYFQEIFRRNAQNRKITRRPYFSAPRVYFDLCSTEVLVEDFVSGIWLWEILAGVEQKKPSALARMKELNIDPKIVARRILWISLWGNVSNVLFHADPHPANVIVQANNRIIFIDFGACGYVSKQKRNRFQEFFRCQALYDVAGMVKASLSMLEPLPPIDLYEFEKDVERVFFRTCVPIWSKQARWWERTSATVWLTLMEYSRKYNLPVNSDTVKTLRATLLYDTLVMRLDNDLDPAKECRRYIRDSLELSGKRMRRSLKKRMLSGPNLRDYAKLEELSRMGADGIERLRRLIDHPPFNFSYSIAKPVYTVITTIKIIGFTGTFLLGSAGLLAGLEELGGGQMNFHHALMKVLSHHAFQALSLMAVLVGIRRIMFRLNDKDV